MDSKIELKELRKRDEYIKEQTHPEFPLSVFKYTQACQYDRAWDEYTKKARGLITDQSGNIIARPFEKFFNVGEHRQKNLPELPNKKPRVYEKLDGSLGIQYSWNDEIYIATQGSFESEQAIWATEWLQNRYDKEDFFEGYTYLYEIIYPDNRIVVDYGDRKELVLLAVKETETGEEIDYIKEAERLGLNYANSLHRMNVEQVEEKLEEIDDGDNEGFVLHWPSEEMRAKMKGDEYLRLHRLFTQLSSTAIWENLKEGESLKELIEEVPDEFYDWINETIEEIEGNYAEIIDEAKRGYDEVVDMETRKEKALYIKEHYQDVASIIFAMLDDKDYEEIIWKKVKPEYSTPLEQNE